mmetsp:Transcript_105953/g.294829  ORF Transcript_105953/g.294829 Transcript_105953/m.294829 type:complete len:215 (-) Transcript_105953:570-1214(-)
MGTAPLSGSRRPGETHSLAKESGEASSMRPGRGQCLYPPPVGGAWPALTQLLQCGWPGTGRRAPAARTASRHPLFARPVPAPRHARLLLALMRSVASELPLKVPAASSRPVCPRPMRGLHDPACRTRACGQYLHGSTSPRNGCSLRRELWLHRRSQQTGVLQKAATRDAQLSKYPAEVSRTGSTTSSPAGRQASRRSVEAHSVASIGPPLALPG